MDDFIAQPPRNLSPLSRLTILLGGFYSQFGWAFFGFGMLFVWIFVFASLGIALPSENMAGEAPPFPLFVSAMILIFPLVGLWFIWTGWQRNQKSIDLLMYGKLTRGEKVSQKPTNTRINKQTVYEYTFSFKAEDGNSYEVTGKTHKTYLLLDEKTERLLYLPQDPSYAALYDIIPHAPRIRKDGNFMDASLFDLGSLIVPLLSIVVHGGILFWVVFG
jgi:hypothetical protein